MASSRRVPTNPTTDTYDSEGGQDYADLGTWEGDTDVDMVATSTSYILDCYKHTTVHPDDVELRGAADDTDADYYRVIRPASGEGHIGKILFDGSCVSFTGAGANYVFRIREDFSQCQDLVAKNTNAAFNGGIFYFKNDIEGAAFVGCMALGRTGTGLQERGFVSEGREGGTDHCFIINCAASDMDDPGYQNMDGYLTIYNCTAYNCDSNGFLNAGTGIIKNCVADENDADNYSGWDSETDTGSDDLTGTDTELNFTFDGVSTDLHLSSGSDGIDAGTDLSADAAYAFDDDINDGVMGGSKAGETRSGTWDMGFDEYVAAATADVFIAARATAIYRRRRGPNE